MTIDKTELLEALEGILNDFYPVPTLRPGRGGRKGPPTRIKKSFSIPIDTYNKLLKLGGIPSHHVSAALNLYTTMLSKRSNHQ